jgi:hypothetical protein
MKQAVNNYSFDAVNKQIVLNNILVNLDQILVIVNSTKGILYYNFASGYRIKYLQKDGSSTYLTLDDAIDTSGASDTDALIIYYDDHTRSIGSSSTFGSFTSITSATLKASNTNRKVLTIYNQGPGNLYLYYGTGASVSNYSIKLRIGDYFEIDKYTGLVSAIFDAAGSVAKVTEII